ncbi:hypothetical protein NicSoilB4_20680 [Arthrobacter sp. NicSoilB4]|nr:hypothetical protein NicSoilB4_20680 [Arthrobacter sp. NicSoilB4]
MVADVGVNLRVLDAAHHLAVLQHGRTEREGVPNAVGHELGGRGAGLVVDPGGAVPVEGEALAGALIAVDAVADDDPGVPEAVVVAVDGEDGVVVGRGVRGGLGDVLAEAVVGKGGLDTVASVSTRAAM